MEIDPKEKFNAEKFVQFLSMEGEKVACDQSLHSYKKSILPEFYDEDLFKKGQIFFYKNRFALTFTTVLGLVAIAAEPHTRRILAFTKDSTTPLKAYKRYMKTLSYILSWYEGDVAPNSRLWKSISSVKSRHNAVSLKSHSAGEARISQYTMSATLIVFMGYPITQREKLGFYNVQDEEWKSLIHFWRVIGYLMGIEDRFNLCRESLEETVDICNVFTNSVIIPNIEKQDEEYMFMLNNIVEGLVGAVIPIFNTNMLLSFVYSLSEKYEKKGKSESPFKLTRKEKIILQLFLLIVASLRFAIFRTIFNYLQKMSIKMTKFWPFPAFLRFGYPNSEISIVG